MYLGTYIADVHAHVNVQVMFMFLRKCTVLNCANNFSLVLLDLVLSPIKYFTEAYDNTPLFQDRWRIRKITHIWLDHICFRERKMTN